MSEELEFYTAADLKDLRTFCSRLLQFQGESLLLQAPQDIPDKKINPFLNAYGAIFFKQNLFDPMPTILAVKSFRTTKRIEWPQTRLYAIRSLTERFAHMQQKQNNKTLLLPPAQTTAVWAGVAPPVLGWQPFTNITAASLKEVAKNGSAEIAATVPVESGQAIIDKIRAELWSRQILPDIPAGAAFALETCGFLEHSDKVLAARNGQWLRLSAKNGSVLIRS